MPHDFTISQRVLSNGRTAYYGKKTGSTEKEFVVGYKTMYEGNSGIYNTVNLGNTYSPEDYENEHGFWAWFLYPTAQAESKGYYNCLNTYDRAKFTFGFMQYASHVPNGDFVIFMKKLLRLPDAANYFPSLRLKNKRIHLKGTNNTTTQLEDDASTKGLMNYFNPSLTEVEKQELDRAARMIHWASSSPDHRKLQVDVAIEHFRSNMVRYHQTFNLHHVPAKVCQMVCDIRHQGRGKNDRIKAALDTNGDFDRAFTNLCTIGSANYQPRINTVKKTINDLLARGLFNKKYDSTTAEFI